ncbi:MAG: IS66 family transposase [Candidatus Omnitrophica bacterium]|nr:IS66 family transposase [Candidatus Omnitrophota bacterium]
MFSRYLCIDEVKKDKKVFAKGGDETNNEDMESDRVQFTEKTKDELIDIILGQNDRIRELEEKVEAEQKKRKKRPGRKKGHEGITRRVPEEIDETIEERLDVCPDCHGELGEAIDVEEQIQEDIIPAYVRVRKYRRHVYCCEHCRQKVYAPYHPEHVPNGYLGANVLIQAAILKYYHCLPYRKICELFKDMAGLNVSPGGISQALARISRWLGVDRAELLEAIRGSPQVHADETGWRLDGKKSWVWAFVNERLAYYHVDLSRGKKVLKEILGEEFNGTLISDFYAVYLKLPYRIQKCLVHLLRDFHDCAKTDHDEEFVKAYKKIKRIIKDAIRLQSKHEATPSGQYARLRMQIEDRLFDFMAFGYKNKNLQRLSKRFAQSWLDMLRFLKDPSLPWHNNFAERMIRPNVIYRNRSFGNRSDQGAEAHGTMMSLMQTLRLQNRNVGENLRKAYLNHRQGHSDPCLSLGTC